MRQKSTSEPVIGRLKGVVLHKSHYYLRRHVHRFEFQAVFHNILSLHPISLFEVLQSSVIGVNIFLCDASREGNEVFGGFELSICGVVGVFQLLKESFVLGSRVLTTGTVCERDGDVGGVSVVGVQT